MTRNKLNLGWGLQAGQCYRFLLICFMQLRVYVWQLIVSLITECNRGTNSTSLIFTTRQWSCWKVIFSVVSVILSTGGFPCDHYPWCIGPWCTASPSPNLPSSPRPQSTGHGTWDPPAWYPRHETWDSLDPSPRPLLLVISSDHHWRPVFTYSLNITVQALTYTDI